MLDVHAPEHRIGGVRDFLMHLLTISVGLLIALGLENSVEALHHRHQRQEAEANIRAEIAQNLGGLKRAAPTVLAERASLLKMLVALDDLAAGKQDAMEQAEKLQFHEEPIPDAAWQTASNTGVLAYMEYDEVERFSAAYKQQAMLQIAEEKALDDYLEFLPLLELHGKALTAPQAAQVLPAVQHALAHLNGMLALGQGAFETYGDALK